jgi:hypothetical protein
MALTLEENHDAFVSSLMQHECIAKFDPRILDASIQRDIHGHADRISLTHEGVKEADLSIWVQTEVGSSMNNVDGKVVVSLFCGQNREFTTDTFVFLPQSLRYTALMRCIEKHSLLVG